eukprot:TRINITY_DN452_c0_g2_i3.p1 TRINITY_DN452_c0_g2~~TRINITY_DN452_c0_g2_i3.p1  ORF type:complete len:280 (-),score=20.83 TRINITY_DN452_c0_g2_i3:45-884(-)
MQDLQLIANGTGRMYGGDRRLRPHPNQALKCPRCDSLNTKFCYYNNYNLSQPRHFCKSCRRYWTKGGVLRNVPVGGGCRKTKRSKPKPSPESQREQKSTSHSSSESSSLTAQAATEASASSTVLNFPDSRLFNSQNPNPNPKFDMSGMENLDQGSDSVTGVFPETGSFTSLMTAANPAILGFSFSDLSSFRFQQQHQQLKMTTSMVEELKFQELTAGFLDQTVSGELPPLQSKVSNGGLTALDWQSHGDQGWFDLPSTVDHGYWNQSQWSESDHSLYLP